MTTHGNKYDYLKIDKCVECPIISEQYYLEIAGNSDETIQIIIAPLPSGEWIYGYNVWWLNGRYSHAKPSPDKGLFRSEREACLHAIGFFLLYMPFYSEATRQSLLCAEMKYAQGSLF